MVAKHVAHCSVANLSLKDFGKQYSFQDISRLWNLKSSGVDAARNRTHLKSGIEGHFIGVWLDSQSRPIGAVGQFEVLLGGASQTNERVITCNNDIITSIYYDILAQLYKYTWRIISYELWVINHLLLGILIFKCRLKIPTAHPQRAFMSERAAFSGKRAKSPSRHTWVGYRGLSRCAKHIAKKKNTLPAPKKLTPNRPGKVELDLSSYLGSCETANWNPTVCPTR